MLQIIKNSSNRSSNYRSLTVCGLVSIKLSLLFSLFWCHCSHLTDATIIIKTTVCPAQLFTILVKTSHATCHKTAWITTDYRLLCLALLESNTFSLLKDLEMKGSCSRHLVKFIATCISAFSYMSFPNNYCCWFRCSIYLLVCIYTYIAVRLCCACVIHLSHTHSDAIVGLLINSSM